MHYMADTGGFFADVPVCDSESCRIQYGKTLTDYGDLVQGILLGLQATRVDLADTLQKINPFLMKLIVTEREQFLRSGAEPMGVPLGQFAEQMRKEVAAYAEVARHANIKPQ